MIRSRTSSSTRRTASSIRSTATSKAFLAKSLRRSPRACPPSPLRRLRPLQTAVETRQRRQSRRPRLMRPPSSEGTPRPGLPWERTVGSTKARLQTCLFLPDGGSTHRTLRATDQGRLGFMARRLPGSTRPRLGMYPARQTAEGKTDRKQLNSKGRGAIFRDRARSTTNCGGKTRVANND